MSAVLTMAGDQYLSPDYIRAVEASALSTASELPQAVRALDAPPQDPMRWLVADVLPLGEIVIFAGDGGAFKSSAAVHIAGAVAGGYDVFDAYPAAQGPVLIVSSEDSLGVVLMRLDAFCVGHGWDRTQVLGNIHVLAEGEPSFSEAAWRFHLVHEVERIRPALVVLDPWIELFGGDENSNSEARPVIKFLRSLAKNAGCTIAVVHHAGKAAEGKRSLDRIRGASALPHSSRAILFFEYLDDGVSVEMLKMSRAPKLPKFVIKREIGHEAGNRAQWTSARLAVEDAKQFQENKAERFILSQLRMSTVPITSTDLRKLASGIPGVRNEDVAKALVHLASRDLIAHDEGKQGAKLWRLTDRSRTGSWEIRSNGASGQETTRESVENGHGPPRSTLPKPFGQPLKNNPAHPAQTLPGQGGENPAHPFRGGAGSPTTTPRRAGSNSENHLDADDLHEQLEERRGIRDDR